MNWRDYLDWTEVIIGIEDGVVVAVFTAVVKEILGLVEGSGNSVQSWSNESRMSRNWES